MSNWALKRFGVRRTLPFFAFAVFIGVSLSPIWAQSAPPSEPALSAGEAIREAKDAETDGDLPKAFHLTAIAAVAGDKDAQNNLGTKYQLAQGVERDYKAAAHWYRLSAKQGNGVAANNLAGLYAEGLGVHADLEAAELLLTMAAEQDVPTARTSLALVRMRIQAQKAGIPDSPGSLLAAGALLGIAGILTKPGADSHDTGVGGTIRMSGSNTSSQPSRGGPDTSIGCAWGDRALGTCH